MSLWPDIANPYIDALVGGFFYGTVFCTSACLPYVSSYIAGVGGGFRKGLTTTLIFNSGRVVAYALLGAAIGLFKIAIGGTYLTSFQQYSSLAFGLVSIILGVSILLKTRSSSHNCPGANMPSKPAANKISSRFDFGAFTLGFSRGFVLCLPLLTLLVYSAAFASPFDSIALAVLFGLGTALSPILLLGGITGWLLNKAPLFQKWIAFAGAGILIILGMSTWISIILAAGI
jgi:sulfite exporter TauE/SafE